MDRFRNGLLTTLSMVLLEALGGTLLVLAERDVDRVTQGRGLVVGAAAIGVVVGFASRTYQRIYGSLYPALIALLLAGAAWVTIASVVHRGDAAQGGLVAAGLVVGYLVAGFRPKLREKIRKTESYKKRVELRRRRRVEAGAQIVTEPDTRCRMCGSKDLLERYVAAYGAEIEPWIRTHGVKLARCSHVKEHVYHVVHFADNDWACYMCGHSLYPDVDK